MKNSCSGIKEDWCCKGKSPWKQHALKGQKLLAQGIALGLECDITKSPCKGKSFKYKKLLPLQGDFLAYA